jgi:hypothetical protein
LEISDHPETYSLINTVGQANADEVIGVFDVGVLTGVHTLTFTATDDPWTGQTSYGQALISEVALFRAECGNDSDCNDGLYCNGAETCVDSVCQAGTAPDCDDGVSCTDDSCNEETDACDNVPNDGNCDDGDVCTYDSCDPALGCINTPIGPATINATVRLNGLTGPLTRCIAFVVANGAECVEVSQSVTFPAGPATADVTLDVACGTWTLLCAKDEQHTLSATATLEFVGGEFQAQSDLVLTGGDTDNDSDVDINDVTFFIYMFGQAATDGGCAWDGTRDADFDANGTVGTEDYTFLSDNWLAVADDCNCGDFRQPAPGCLRRPVPAEAVATLSASQAPSDLVRRVDLNEDGVISFRDVRIFEQRVGLGDALSKKIERTDCELSAPTETCKSPIRSH